MSLRPRIWKLLWRLAALPGTGWSLLSATFLSSFCVCNILVRKWRTWVSSRTHTGSSIVVRNACALNSLSTTALLSTPSRKVILWAVVTFMPPSKYIEKTRHVFFFSGQGLFFHPLFLAYIQTSSLCVVRSLNKLQLANGNFSFCSLFILFLLSIVYLGCLRMFFLKTRN